MKNIRKIAAVLMTLLLCVPFFNVTSAKAAGTARVSIGSASGTVGETVSVTVSIDASFEIGAATIYVSYDTSVLEPVSGSNTGTVTCNFLDSNASSSQSSSISFRIKAAGTSSLSVIGDSKVISMDYDNASISRSSGSITGIAPASYSTDNTLSSLEISPGVLSPAFSSNVTTYTTSVGSDCDRLTVSAAPNDSKATVKVSGTRMDPGLNTTTITVTAENGSKKVYTIKTTKSDNVITPEQASKEAEETDGTNQGGTTDGDNNSIIQEPAVSIDGNEYKVISSFDEHPLPSGYVQSETDYNGIKIAVGMGTNTRVMLAYLESTDGTGESGFYVYDSVKKTFSKYIEVYQPELSYCILPIDESSMELPDGYEAGRININNREVDVLLDKTGNYALFYGVSSTGDTGWFRYNINDGTIQGYAGYNSSDEPALIHVQDKEASAKGVVNVLKGTSYIILALLVVLVLIIAALIVAVIVLSRKLSVSKKAFVKAMDEYDDSDEYDELLIKKDDSDDSDNDEADSQEHDEDIEVSGDGTEDYKDEIKNTIENDNVQNSNTYRISGVVWFDENRNGTRDSGEKLLSGIPVTIVDAKTGKAVKNSMGNEISATTDDKGEYILSDLIQGQYIVKFNYDNSQYVITEYRKQGIDEAINSDAINTTENNGVAITDSLTITDTSMSNIDLGLTTKGIFDLSLNKTLTKIQLADGKTTKEVNFENKKLGKIEVDGKRINSTNLVIEYTMTITNNGNVAGYAKKIVDYLPSELEFSSNLNEDWYSSGDTVICTALENELINPGETKEVKLLLTKKMNENGTGTVTNKAEITETYNDQGLLDEKSTEDDTNSSANVIIGIKTGGPVTYVVLTLTILAIAACGAYIINKKVLKV